MVLVMRFHPEDHINIVVNILVAHWSSAALPSSVKDLA